MFDIFVLIKFSLFRISEFPSVTTVEQKPQTFLHFGRGTESGNLFWCGVAG
jgi:hypothetical protein